MTKSFKMQACVLAGALILSPVTAMAQNTATTTGDTNMMDAPPMTDTMANDMAMADTVQPERDDDNDFPWGLLGLLGLAGLLGRKRHDDHVHVDRTDRTDGPPTNNRM